MRVALFTYEFPPRIYGGAGVHILHLATQLRHLVDLEIRTLHPAEEMEGATVRRYRPSLPQGPVDRAGKALEVLSLNVNLAADPVDADIVHTHTWYTSVAGFLARTVYGPKLVTTVHSLEPRRPWKEEQLGKGYAISAWAEQLGLEACDGVIAVSTEMGKDIRAHYAVPSERLQVIPNGVDVQAFQRREDPTILERLDVEPPYVLFLGRLSRQKGIEDLLRAFGQLKERVSLVLVTGAPDTPDLVEELRAQVAPLDRIRWIHRTVTHEEAVALYSSCAVFVSPSRYEPFGIINLEAMACARPVVATRVGGIPEVVVDEETGLLVPPEDPAALARALDALLANRDRAEAMGKRGRRRVEKEFTWTTVAERTVAFYRALLDSAG